MRGYGGDYSLIWLARRTPGGYIPTNLPEWPTPPQTGTLAHWGDDIPANLVGGAARLMWDWPAHMVREAYVEPEVVPWWLVR